MGSESGSNKGGRPKVAPSDYNANWKEDVLSAYSKGKSDIWVMGKCFGERHISYDLWYRWLEEDEEFSGAVKQGRRLSQVWWEDKSQEHAIGDNQGNATTLIFNMTNRFRNDWKQRQVVESETKLELDVKDLDKLEEFLKDNGVDTSAL